MIPTSLRSRVAPAPSREQRIEARAQRLGAMAAGVGASPRPAAVCGGITAGPRPKAAPTRPGKRSPTAAERAWMDFVVRWGCVACRLDGQPPRPTAVHHILSGSRRIGHLATIGLCDPGHHQGGQQLGLISRHPWKARFEARYGTEQELLELTRQAFAADRQPAATRESRG